MPVDEEEVKRGILRDLSKMRSLREKELGKTAQHAHKVQEAERKQRLADAVKDAKSQWKPSARSRRRKGNRKRISPDTMRAMLENTGSYKVQGAQRAIRSAWGEDMPRAADIQVRNAARRLSRGLHRGGGTRRRRRRTRRTRRQRRYRF